VWTPSGGWWNNEPPHWERNTGIAAVAVLITAGVAFSFSAEREVRNAYLYAHGSRHCKLPPSILQRRPVPPLNFIPSQIWSKHAVEDDPRLQPLHQQFPSLK